MPGSAASRAQGPAESASWCLRNAESFCWPPMTSRTWSCSTRSTACVKRTSQSPWPGLMTIRLPARRATRQVPVNTTVEQVAADDFDALIIPGGYAPDKLRRSEAVLALVRAFDSGSRSPFPCRWCRGCSAKILKGRRATSVTAIRDDMVNAGVELVNQATVINTVIVARFLTTSARLDEGTAGSARPPQASFAGRDARARGSAFTCPWPGALTPVTAGPRRRASPGQRPAHPGQPRSALEPSPA